MSRRQSAFAYAALLLGGISFASSFARPTAGQQAVSTPGVVGRYQIATSGSSASPNVYVIDTVTGKVWWSSENEPNGAVKEWVQLKPIPAAR